MNKAKFLDALQQARSEWEAVIADIDQGQMEIPGVEGEWTIRDIIAHVTWYEREMVGMLRARALVGSPHWNLPSQDARNVAIYADIRSIPLATVLAQSNEVYRQLVEAIQALTEEDLVDAGKFRDMPGDWVPWQVIASNSYEHYPQHIPLIRTWLDNTDLA